MGKAALEKSSIKLAKKLLAKFGGTATYSIVVAESTDQTTGTTIPASKTDIVINTYQRGGTLEELSSSQVTNSQKVFLIEANSLTSKPSSDDVILMNGETFKFSEILREVSGGQNAVLYYVIFGV